MDLHFDSTLPIIPTLKETLMKEPSRRLQMGNSQGETRLCKEIIGASFTIHGWDDLDAMLFENNLDFRFIDMDLNDRLLKFPVNPGRAIKYDKEGVLSKYLNEKGRLKYTYSERMFYQLDSIISVLSRVKETRQAFLSIWDPTKDIFCLEEERVPCSLGYHFFRRDDQLIMRYLMRSLEVTRCLGNDIVTSIGVLDYVARRVGTSTGYVQFNVGSMHLFI